MSDWGEVVLVHGEKPSLPESKNILRAPGLEVPEGLPERLWDMLDNWEMIVPLVAVESDVAGLDVHLPTKYVPLWNTKLLFVRRCRAVYDLLREWDGGNEAEFMDALYRVKPKVLALAPLEL